MRIHIASYIHVLLVLDTVFDRAFFRAYCSRFHAEQADILNNKVLAPPHAAFSTAICTVQDSAALPLLVDTLNEAGRRTV